MSEKVSLDFLISLKQANANVEQTRKVGGIMDYLATTARRANDALFQTSKGEDASKREEASTKKTSKLAMMKAASLAAAGAISQKVLSGTVSLVKASVGWWAEHAGAMTTFRRELGYSSEETHTFTMGVSRAAAVYGTSLRSVRDVAAFMAQGARTGQKEIVKLAGTLASLAEYGGVSTGTINDFVQTMSFAGNKTDEQATHMLLAIKNVAEAANVPAEGVIRAFTEIKDLLPQLTTNVKGAEQGLVTMYTAVAKNREAAGSLSSFMQRGDLMAYFDMVEGQVGTLWGRVEAKDEDAVKAAMIRARAMGIQSLTQLKAIMIAQKARAKNQGDTDAMFAKSADELEKRLQRDLTVMEQLHAKVKSVKAAATGFWEGFMGGQGGKALLAILDKITEKLNSMAEVFGFKLKKDAGSADLVKKAAQTQRARTLSTWGGGWRSAVDVVDTPSRVIGSWLGLRSGRTLAHDYAINQAVEAGHGTTEEYMRMHQMRQQQHFKTTQWRAGRGERGFVPSYAAVQDANVGDVAQLKADYAQTGDKRVLDLLVKIGVALEDGNEERRKGNRAAPGSTVGNAARAERVR
jgi:hypothetical protein